MDRYTVSWPADRALKLAVIICSCAAVGHPPGGSSANSNNTADDLVEQVAADMIKEAWLLCFDEFQVTHISFLASQSARNSQPQDTGRDA